MAELVEMDEALPVMLRDIAHAGLFIEKAEIRHVSISAIRLQVGTAA